MHSFRFEATYDCPVSHLLAITREFDLLGTWNRMALDPAILAELSNFTTVNYVGAAMEIYALSRNSVANCCWAPGTAWRWTPPSLQSCQIF